MKKEKEKKMKVRKFAALCLPLAVFFTGAIAVIGCGGSSGGGSDSSPTPTPTSGGTYFMNDGSPEPRLDSQFWDDNIADGAYLSPDPSSATDTAPAPLIIDPFNEANPNFQVVNKLPNTVNPSTIDPWFDSTDYIGAFDGTNDWTSGWIVSGQGTPLPAGTPTTKSGTICTNETWSGYIELDGLVFVGEDGNAGCSPTLTIQAGTVIVGIAGTPPGTLVITRGSKISAEGTLANPITFTSPKPADGTRSWGDWGGLVINGKAKINTCDYPTNGPCEAQGEGSSGLYGGSDDTDDSGILKYVRVEFAGHLFTSEDELNGIGLQGVGNGTEIDYIQIHMNADDGIEMFGGNVDVKHVVLTGNADDSFDFTYGWRGRAQHVVVQHYAGDADQGMEMDNNGDHGNDNLPRTQPMLANFTLIGSPNSSKSDIGMLLREGMAGNFYSFIVTGFNECLMDIDDAATWQNAYTDINNGVLSGELTFEDMWFYQP